MVASAVVGLVGCTFDGTGLGVAGGTSSAASEGSGASSTSIDASTSDGSTTTTGALTDGTITATTATDGPTSPTSPTDPTTTMTSSSTTSTSEGSTSGCDAMQEYFLDDDGDGFGAGDPILACAAPPGTSPYDGDCDDDAPAIHPAADEVCDGGAVDEDCDGLINEHSAKNTSCGLCELAYFKNTDHVYWFCDASATWDVARSACQKVGADLVMIGGDGENSFVRGETGAVDVWLGARDQDPNVDNGYTWVDGQALTYFNWAAGNPNEDDGCVAMTDGDGGKWRDYGCGSETFSYVCESG